ncbi:Ff.00g096340.m01.CDS01 [Fusarium sp. VM40]|nr:Ff.00g096340.m01.CDS01 [Fusarium sp. VM40]
MATGVDARLLKSTKFPPEFSQKVDMQKVNLQVMKKWIASKISDILGNEDDVVIELVFNLIEGPRYPDIKSLQIQLTGFLDKDTAKFCKDLWKLLLSAQSSPQGVPKELLEAKKLELIQEKIEADRAAENAKQRRGDWDRRDREVADMKDRDRRDRGATPEEEGVSEEEVVDHDRQALAPATPGTHLGVTVTSLEADVEEVALIMLDESRLPGHVQDRLHFDRARAAVADHAAAIRRTGDDELHLQEHKEMDGRGRAHLEGTHIEAAQTDVVNETARLAHPVPHLPIGNLQRRSVDATLHQGVARSPAADDPQEVSHHHDLEELQIPAAAVEAEVTAVAAVVVALPVHRRTAGPRGGQVLDEVVSGLQRGKNRRPAGDETVLQLLRAQEFGKSQLMFLKMNLVPHRPSPRQRWPGNEVSEVSLI